MEKEIKARRKVHPFNPLLKEGKEESLPIWNLHCTSSTCNLHPKNHTMSHQALHTHRTTNLSTAAPQWKTEIEPASSSKPYIPRSPIRTNQHKHPWKKKDMEPVHFLHRLSHNTKTLKIANLADRKEREKKRLVCSSPTSAVSPPYPLPNQRTIWSPQGGHGKRSPPKPQPRYRPSIPFRTGTAVSTKGNNNKKTTRLPPDCSTAWMDACLAVPASSASLPQMQTER